MRNEADVTLWQHADFLKLWLAQTTSQIGTQISFLAFPLVAVLTLDATPLEMGLLTAASALPPALIGLPAGAWLDYRRRRPVLITCDLLRGALLLLIPLLAVFDILRIEHLFIIAFLTGVLSLGFDVAYRSYLPGLVPRSQLIDGNSKLELSRAAGELAGPALGGALVRLLTAPVALLADAFSFFASAIFLRTIRSDEQDPPEREPGASIRSDIRAGLAAITRHPLIRGLAVSAGTVGFFNSLLEAVFILYITQDLGIGPALLGVVLSAGAAGFLVGALLPARLMGRLGAGRALIAAIVLVGLADLLVPLAAGPTWAIAVTIGIAQFLFGIGLTSFSVLRVSLLQMEIPEHLQGRAHATMRTLLAVGVPLGAIVGGVLGETIGLRATLVVAACGEIAAIVWLLIVSDDGTLTAT